jgi:hypothetical protein
MENVMEERMMVSDGDIKFMAEFAIEYGTTQAFVPIVLQWVDSASAEINNLRARVKELEADKNAARYKFYRDNVHFLYGMFNINTERGAALHKIGNCGDVESLDIAIDEAIEVFKGKRCEPCRATGMIHCANPESCGGPWSDPVK